MDRRITQGEDFKEIVDFGNHNLTGYTFTLEFRTIGIETVLVSVPNYTPSNVTALGQGKLVVEVDGVDMNSLASSSCVFEAKAQLGDKVQRQKLTYSVDLMVIDQPFDLVTTQFQLPSGAMLILAPVADTAALAALPSTSFVEGQQVWISSENTYYFYHPAATSGDVAPTDQTGGNGFWSKQSTSSETPASVLTKFLANADTNVLSDSLLAKLNAIEANAKDDQTAAEIAGLIAAESGINLLTDTEKTKIADSALASDLSGKVDKRGDRVTVTGTNYHLRDWLFVSDGLDLDKDTEQFVNIKDNVELDSNCPVGVDLELMQVGTAPFTVAIAGSQSSATLLSTENKSPGLYKPVILRQVSLDNWIVIGGIA